jgi:hypothetical protein
MMIFLKFIIGVMVINLLSIFTIHALVASFNPTLYGKYLQTMDDSRYEYIERE